MKLKYVYYLIPALLIVAANIYWGSVISWFLSICIVSILLFFAGRLAWEGFLTSKLKDVERNSDQVIAYATGKKKGNAILSFLLLSIVFLSAAFAVFRTTNPLPSKAWFLNNDYHSLNHKGIAFDKNLTFYTYSSEQGEGEALSQVKLSKAGAGKATINFNHCFKPVFERKEDQKRKILNNIFPENLNQGFRIQNEDNELEILIEKKEPSFFASLFLRKKERFLYTIKLKTKDAELLEDYRLKSPFQAEITMEDDALKYGMTLYNLFLDNETFDASSAESFPILEAILQKMGATYLLVDNSSDYSIHLFPSLAFFQNHYQLYNIQGKELNPHLINETSIEYGQYFYIGFNNYKQLLSIEPNETQNEQLGTEPSLALLFDFPNMYQLKSPGQQELGHKNRRFMTNDFNALIQDSWNEGFYFTTYNLKFQEKINANFEYTSGAAHTALQADYIDYNKGRQQNPVVNGQFSLSTTQPGIHYLFELRDFSKGGFHYSKILIYLAVTYLLFVFLASFHPGKKLERLEPIILTVIFALLTIRYLLFWRLSTFPPLENISKHELENTLRNFDFNFGFDQPIPFTLILTALFVFVIVWIRRQQEKKQQLNFLKKWELQMNTIQKVVKTYVVGLLLCFVVFILNKKVLHIEILTRIVSILLPLIAYCYFSVLAAKKFSYKPMPFSKKHSRLWTQVRAYVFYLFHNPTVFITLSTILFFAIADRGFAILFCLFILLKNILVNFLKKPFISDKTTLAKMLLKPHNYWVFGLAALICYLAILAYKPLFYYLLLYKLEVGLVILALGFVVLWVSLPEKKKILKIYGGAVLLYLLLILIPFSRHAINHVMDESIKFVRYRAAIIHLPLDELMQQNEYSSFKTKKIIETAENQWFINSYIDKTYDNSATINLRPFSKIGVDYPTQTRDVMVARFLISEMGNFTMYLILILCLLPLILYLTSYKIILIPNGQSEEERIANIGSYAGLIPLIIFFTLALFVWLTSTNRFVFFGQDFPFLSMTSRLSVLMPLLLLGFTLVQIPKSILSNQVNIKGNAIKYVFFTGLIAVFALTTVRKNELNNKNFSIIMETTKEHIDGDLNSILTVIQDSLKSSRINYSYPQLIQALKNDDRFKELKDDIVTDEYTKSILEQLIEKPSTALKLNNPLFIIYDGGYYQSVYNKNLYLELPPVENRNIWNGKIKELQAITQQPKAFVTFPETEQQVNLPFYYAHPQGMQWGILPAKWLAYQQEPIGIIGMNAKEGDELFIYKNDRKVNSEVGSQFSQTVKNEDFVTIQKSGQSYNFSFQSSGRSFAFNKWVNGRYKIIYPLRADNFWIYNYANGIKSVYSNDTDKVNTEYITLDYSLMSEVQKDIENVSTAFKNNSRYNFSVIAADGNGHVRLMNDFVSNRKRLDPNDEVSIFNLQQQQFFFSNAKNERDQWGNRNLLNLYLGPGSSIKPLFAAVIASQVNAGWENLILQPALVKELENYGGLALQRKWLNEEHYGGDVGMAKYIEFSSNFYQAALMFLGSYTKADFNKEDQYQLQNILSKTAGKNNTNPAFNIRGQRYYLPNLDNRKGNWPKTDAYAKHPTYFGNENSLISIGFQQNVGLNTTRKSIVSNDREQFVRPTLFYRLDTESSGAFLWSFPEVSNFLQEKRDYKSIQENFNSGLKTPSLGGYPFQISAFKMLEMYLSLMNMNRDFHLMVNPHQIEHQDWQIDPTWKNNSAFKQFLAQNIFKGMQDVIFGGNGTAKKLSYLKSKNPQFYYYAKTGTINEHGSGKKSSRRLIVTISNKDLTQAQNIGSAKTYGFYFAIDSTGDFDWSLLMRIIDNTMASASFQNYFKD